MLKVVQEAPEPNVAGSVLDEIVRDGARQMLAAALQAEVAAYIDAHWDQVVSRVAGWWSATAITNRAG
jgi:hypothetical protein